LVTSIDPNIGRAGGRDKEHRKQGDTSWCLFAAMIRGTIAQQYASGSPVSAVRNDKTLCLVGNFDRCIERAKRCYISVWDQDDVMTPQNLETKIALVEANHPHRGSDQPAKN
jgi:hypothetical protein